MQSSGAYCQWKSYPVKTGDGYNLVLFRLIADSNGTPFDTSGGPLLLTSGAFSDTTDWLTRVNEESLDPAVAVMLAQRGRDVWIASGRCRQFSRTHDLWDPLSTDPAIRKNYFDYSFEEVGEQDIPAFVDTIIAERSSSVCEKVTLMPHGSGVNQALIAAMRAPQFSEKVDQITALAPCLQINDSYFFNGVLKDPLTVQLFYSVLEEVGVTSLFGSNFDVEK